MISAAPSWTGPYRNGDKIGYAQGMMAYADYHGTDGSADLNPEIEERLPFLPQPLVSYASRTGTRKNLEAMRAAGWRLLVSATGVQRTEGMRYAIDSGAWTAYQAGTPFDEVAFCRAVEKLGESADWIVLPDVVAGGLRSLEMSLAWRDGFLRGIPTQLLIAVQDGMSIDDVREHLSPAVGLFIGGTTQWKETTAVQWGVLARRRNCHLHVGRVNSARRIRICAAAGAHSIDGTSVTRFAKTLGRLDRAVRQADIFSPDTMLLRDTAQPLLLHQEHQES